MDLVLTRHGTRIGPLPVLRTLMSMEPLCCAKLDAKTKTGTSETVEVEYSSVCSPVRSFELRLQWLSCGVVLEELRGSLAKAAKRLGCVTFVQVPTLSRYPLCAPRFDSRVPCVWLAPVRLNDHLTSPAGAALLLACAGVEAEDGSRMPPQLLAFETALVERLGMLADMVDVGRGAHAGSLHHPCPPSKLQHQQHQHLQQHQQLDSGLGVRLGASSERAKSSVALFSSASAVGPLATAGPAAPTAAVAAFPPPLSARAPSPASTAVTASSSASSRAPSPVQPSAELPLAVHLPLPPAQDPGPAALSSATPSTSVSSDACSGVAAVLPALSPSAVPDSTAAALPSARVLPWCPAPSSLWFRQYVHPVTTHFVRLDAEGLLWIPPLSAAQSTDTLRKHFERTVALLS